MTQPLSNRELREQLQRRAELCRITGVKFHVLPLRAQEALYGIAAELDDAGERLDALAEEVLRLREALRDQERRWNRAASRLNFDGLRSLDRAADNATKAIRAALQEGSA